jgi:hypothetical protein
MSNEILVFLLVTFIMTIPLIIHMISNLKQVKTLCKRHIWREFLVEMPNPEDNTKVLYCEVCGILPSSDLENPQYIEFYKK